MAASPSRPNPKKTDLGPVDETNTYTLNATNVCGGSTTQTAAVHITGSIEPVPTVVLYSIFYPTDYPDAGTRGWIAEEPVDAFDRVGGRDSRSIWNTMKARSFRSLLTRISAARRSTIRS